jgi:hypothetical protein
VGGGDVGVRTERAVLLLELATCGKPPAREGLTRGTLGISAGTQGFRFQNALSKLFFVFFVVVGLGVDVHTCNFGGRDREIKVQSQPGQKKKKKKKLSRPHLNK